MKQRDLHNILKHRPYTYNTHTNKLERYTKIHYNKVYIKEIPSKWDYEFYYPMTVFQKYSNWSYDFITLQQAQQLYPEYFI